MRQRLERIRLKKKEAGKVVATERTEPELRRVRGKQRPSTQWRAAAPDIAERRMPEDAVRLGDVGTSIRLHVSRSVQDAPPQGAKPRAVADLDAKVAGRR